MKQNSEEDSQHLLRAKIILQTELLIMGTSSLEFQYQRHAFEHVFTLNYFLISFRDLASQLNNLMCLLLFCFLSHLEPNNYCHILN